MASTGESTAFLAATPAPAWRRLRQFLLWHLLGAIAFALAFGLLGYFAGAAAVNLVERFGAYAGSRLQHSRSPLHCPTGAYVADQRRHSLRRCRPHVLATANLDTVRLGKTQRGLK